MQSLYYNKKKETHITMQTKTTAENLIYTGRYPFHKFGTQTDRHFVKPDPNDPHYPISGPNDATKYVVAVSLRTLTNFTGTQQDNFYLITLPSVIDRPRSIQIVGTTIAHLDTSNIAIKTVYVQSPIVKQSGYHFITTSNISTTNTDELVGVIRVPHISVIGTVFTIATNQVIMKSPIKDQGYGRIIGIPVRFLDNRGESLTLGTDLDLDGELILQLECDTYNPTKLSRG